MLHHLNTIRQWIHNVQHLSILRVKYISLDSLAYDVDVYTSFKLYTLEQYLPRLGQN
jgi:hypothetical protein